MALAQARPSPGRKRNAKNKDPDSPMLQKVKQKRQKRATRLDKLTGNGKHMNGIQIMDLHRSEARIRLQHHPLVPSQYKHGGPWARGKRGYGLVVDRKGKSILGFLLKLFWGKCPARMTYHPKERKMSWNH